MPFPCAKTIPKSDQTSAFSNFRSTKSFERKGAPFAGEPTRSFSIRRTYIYVLSSFNAADIVKTLSGIKKVAKGVRPTIFNPQEVPSSTSEREKRMISRRGKRKLRDESDLKFPAKSPRVSSDVALKDHDYTYLCKENKLSSSPTEKNISKVNESASVSCQTDIDQLQMEELVTNVARLKTENKVLRHKINNKAVMKRELFMDNNDESMKFYTALPTLTCLMAIFNILKPEKLKYWDSNKGNKSIFRRNPLSKRVAKREA